MALFLLLGTILPTILYMALLWWLDKYEKESWWLFLGAFFYGCIPAIILSILLELPFSGLGNALESGLVAPAVEETIKGLGVLIVFLVFRREFDDVLDGIVYGGAIGFGFAMVETFLYAISTGSIGVLALRILPFGLNHAAFTACTGAGLGLARQSKKRWLWLVLFPLALAVGTFFHAVHNNVIQVGCLGLVVALGFDWGGVAVLLVAAILSWGQERRWIQVELGEEVAVGLLAPTDQQALLSVARRTGARLWMWRHYGWRAFRLLGRYFYLATELAFRKHHLRSGTADPRWAQEVDKLRQQMQQVRAQLAAIRGPA
jgi:RsiW-degrading membrane proteinase PrsW (M82 family)